VLLSSLFILSLADLPAIHEKPITLRVKSGGPLSIKIPAPTNIWHRKFKDGREQYMEACNEFIDVCEKWRSGFIGKDIHTQKVSLAKDGTLNMPKVTSSDSAQYYTYYRAKDGIHHYSYFNVIVA
ncbi:hypothetical protein PMAYCL1PPCAC_22587, partial [Pristionchus mayeri]